MGSIPVTRYFQFSDDGRKLLTRFQPAMLWDLEAGEVKPLSEQESRQDVPGFGPRSSADQQEPGAAEPAPQELLERWQDRIPASARGVQQTADGRRLIVYHHDFGIAVGDIATGEPLYRCYLFHNGSRWLTVMSDGQCHGALQHVRYRESRTPAKQK
jgi:hypothetical protein